MYLMPGYWLLPHQSLGNTVMNYGLSNSESAQQLYQEIFLFQNILRSWNHSDKKKVADHTKFPNIYLHLIDVEGSDDL